MTTHGPWLGSGAEYGRQVYEELGALTGAELAWLAARDPKDARRYCSSIYGVRGGQVAWMELTKWVLRNEGREMPRGRRIYSASPTHSSTSRSRSPMPRGAVRS